MIIKWPKNKNVGDVYTSPSGSKWKWNGKAWTSFREATDSMPQASPNGVTYQFSHSPMDPADNMSYYIGDIGDSPAQSNGSISSKRVKSLVDGKVTHVSIMTQILNQLGSSESQTFALNNHTKGTSALITSDYRNLTNSQLDNFVLDSPLEVSSNDELYVVWSVYAFSISPISVRHNFNIYIER